MKCTKKCEDEFDRASCWYEMERINTILSYKLLTLFNRQKNTHNHQDIIYFAPHSERRHENGFSPFAI